MRFSGLRPFRKTRLCAGICAAIALGSVSLPLLAVEVQNCGDGGPGSGSLRDVIASAAPGATIDLSQLPTKCGMTDSTITLLNGEIAVPQDNLTLQGPSVGSVTITPAAGSQGRILHHTGNGLLAINYLTLANGNLEAGVNAAPGGCVESYGSLSFMHSTVRDCTATGGSAYGGGIHADGSVKLVFSTVSGNKAIAPPLAIGNGGGVFAGGSLAVKYSALSENEATAFGGGAYSRSFASGIYTSFLHSTIEGNKARNCGAATLYTGAGVSISNSTVSRNSATYDDGGLCVTGLVDIANSTIAFNTSSDQNIGGSGVMASLGQLTLESTIIAQNGEHPFAPDLYVNMGVSVSGSDNVIMSANANVPASVIKITADPKLGPLQYNGGRTRTHALLPGSLAIGAGNSTAGSTTDQRGHGYPRMTGAGATTDIGAFQFDSIFAHDFQW